MTTANPRRAAYAALLRIEKEHAYADILINRELTTGALQGPDRALFTEIVYGTLRRQGTLDHIINQCSSRPVARLERSVLLLLRLGLYQIFFLDRVPVSAAVNETVILAHEFAPRAAGFINAVLRQADRQRDAIPYPDRTTDPAAYLAARHSHPRWLADLWCRQLGPEEAESLASAMSAAPPLTLRVNTLRTGRDELIARLTAEGASAAPGRYSPHAVQLSGPVVLTALPSFREGLFTVQDESSQLAAIFLAPAAGERVLDLCAAPGGKTTHLAQLMGNQGKIIACDNSAKKLGLLTETADRLGITCIATRPLDAAKGPLPFREGEFGRVLLDAPCSGLGVLRRNPEGKWWKTPANIAELAAQQKTLIGNAAPLVAPGGRLLYATCSTTEEENEAIVDEFLSRRPDFVLEDLRESFPALGQLFTDRGCFRSWPHRHGMDGFFAARLRRT
ncbi:MAG TPA: 16S rRNA (cytosine(967)-C(5))-methyltransferase RsmB [Geobacteraceae bacterium]